MRKIGNVFKTHLNNRGATLSFALLGLMVVSVSVAAMVMSAGGFMERILTIHEDKQVYLSARSVAEAIATQVAEDSYHRIMALEPEVRIDMDNLPFEMQTGETTDVVLTTVQKNLIAGIEAMEESDVIDLGTIKFNNSPSKVTLGTVTASLTRIENGYFIIAATATIDDEVEVVRTVLQAYGYNVEEEEERIPEIDGNWEGFFMDFGYDLGPDGILTNLNGDEKGNIATTTPIYESPSIGGLYSTEDIIVIGGTKSNGVMKTTDLIYFEDLEISGLAGSVYSGTSLTMVGEMLTSVSLEAPIIRLIGDGGNLQGGTDEQSISCEIFEIEGNDITISAPITCDELYITGDNITISGEINANVVYLSGTMGDIANITTQRMYVAEGTTNLYYRPITTQTGYVVYENHELPLVLMGDHEGFKYNIATDEELEELEIELTDFIPVTRSKPTWANYTPTEVQLFEATQIGNDVWWGRPDVEQMVSGYYFIDKDKVEPETVTTEVEINGSTYTRVEHWNTIEIGNAVSATGRTVDDPLVIIVRDGQNLRLDVTGGAGAIPSSYEYIYFILEGNAKIELPTGETYTRIYGEAPTVRVYNEVQESIQLVIDMVMADADGDYTQIDFDGAKELVHDIMSWYYDEIAMILAPDGATLVGNAIIPYIMTDNKDFTWRYVPYGTDVLEFEDFLVDEAQIQIQEIQEKAEAEIAETALVYESGEPGSAISALRSGYSTSAGVIPRTLDEYTLFEFVGYIK